MRMPLFFLLESDMPSNNQPPRIKILSDGSSDHCEKELEEERINIVTRNSFFIHLGYSRFMNYSKMEWVVELDGIEPTTFSLPARRSPS